MRTTLDIADDVLFAVKEIAQREKKSIGQVMSDLARKAFAVGPVSRKRLKPCPKCQNAWPNTASSPCLPGVRSSAMS